VHTFPANVLGALAVTLSDGLRATADSDSAALITLSERGPLTIEFLRRIVGLSHSATVRLVDRLAEQDLVERRQGPDRRSRSVALTARGRRRAAGVQRRRAEMLAAALAALDSRERREFARLAGQVLAGLTTSRSQARFTCRLCDHGACRDAGGCPVDQAATALGQ
jgi:DNA-binding MarR family transcriptional regulator